MKIIIIGCGKVGYTLAKNLSLEDGVNITIVDNKSDSFEKTSESIDAMLIKGDGLNANTLIEAGAKEADLLISVTNDDSVNILCCISAKHIGVKHTAARVRNPEYAFDTNKFWKSLGLDLIINPEQETAREISRLLRFPTVDDIDIFVGGRVELVSFQVSEAYSFFENKSVSQIFHKKKMNVILALIERDETVIIPHGDLIFQKQDIIRILGRSSDIMNFFALTGKNIGRIKNTVIIGGGKITHYLVELLHRHSSSTGIKIIEVDREKCEDLSIKYPRCLFINGDGTDVDILSSEVVDKTGAVVCLTDRDEENTVIALYSLQSGMRKVVAKIDHIDPKMVKSLRIGSIISPKNITTEQIIRYIRGLSNVEGNNVKTIYRIFENNDDKVEAVEININNKAKCLSIPIKELKIKKGILIGCIIRNSNILIPSGEEVMQLGDSIIIIVKNDNIFEIEDILL